MEEFVHSDVDKFALSIFVKIRIRNTNLVEWSLDGPLPKLCPVIPTSNQDGRQDINRKRGGYNFNCPLLL
jgi:hypothetical protein